MKTQRVDWGGSVLAVGAIAGVVSSLTIDACLPSAPSTVSQVALIAVPDIEKAACDIAEAESTNQWVVIVCTALGDPPLGDAAPAAPRMFRVRVPRKK